MNQAIQVRPVDMHDMRDADALVLLLNQYALGDTGGGKGLPDDVKRALPDALRKLPHFHGFIAWMHGKPAGLMTCFKGFSTFKAKPLLNIHDLIVGREFRRMGVARMLLARAEELAREMGCCKLTLEVLQNNQAARLAYEGFGFHSYQLKPEMGVALFLEKRLA